jgi:hypothetical protein
MNNSQKTRQTFMNFMRESSDNETAARIALFRKTNEGTRGMSRDQLATEMVRNGVTLREIKAAL